MNRYSREQIVRNLRDVGAMLSVTFPPTTNTRHPGKNKACGLLFKN